MKNEHYYSWGELDSDTRKLCHIASRSFKPDYIVGVSRGGIIPAIIISHFFDVPFISLSWSLRDHENKDVALLHSIQRKMVFENKKILLIDDIVDSGETLKQIHSILGKSDLILYTTLWFNISQSNAAVDIFINHISRSKDDRWIMFPYEN